MNQLSVEFKSNCGSEGRRVCVHVHGLDESLTSAELRIILGLSLLLTILVNRNPVSL